ncbi:uncharacterized protein LOC136086012 [Hydra vulgaris]|uniref:Secreted protein n=1 Tax=Hydra vulgaris TaxID=6087 RepID=B3VQ08_HYDVU|nr:secreted protein [Hydra vulgaris]
MTQTCILLLCVAFFALIDAQPKTALSRDSKKSSEFIKLNDPLFEQLFIIKMKKSLDHVAKLKRSNVPPVKIIDPPRRCHFLGTCSLEIPPSTI